jgi:hypothetical protein
MRVISPPERVPDLQCHTEAAVMTAFASDFNTSTHGNINTIY